MAPKLWSETIDAHRREVREAILAATLDLLAQRGVRGVTMSQIAERVGIGRVTPYKYFPDVEAILVAHHLQHVAGRPGTWGLGGRVGRAAAGRRPEPGEVCLFWV